MRAFLCAAFASLLIGHATAAVLTVGPSGQFAQITDALVVAQPDDVILVEPGTYDPFVVDKPVRVLGQGADVVVTSLGTWGIHVTGIGAGEEAVVSGLDVRANPVFSVPTASVYLSNNAGTVLLHDLDVDGLYAFPGIQVDSSARAVLMACDVQAGPPGAVVATGSELWIAESTLIGSIPFTGFSEPGSHALQASACTLHAWRSIFRAGDGASGKPSFFIDPDGGDGIHADASTANLYGGSVGEVSGGDGASGGFFGNDGAGGAGLRLLNGSTARVQQSIPITGGVDATGSIATPPIVTDGSSSFSQDATIFPALIAGAAQTSLGGNFVLQFDANPSAVAVLFVSFDTGPTLTLPGVEGLSLLNPAQFLQLAVVLLDGLGAATVPAAVPATPSLLGTTLIFQAAEAAGAQLAITNPALVTVTQ